MDDCCVQFVILLSVNAQQLFGAEGRNSGHNTVWITCSVQM
jgi:hypothetical protein